MRLSLLAQMEALKAEELLASPLAAHLSGSELYAAVLAATGDEARARRARNTRDADILEAGGTPT